jgi:hypothetical protein
MNAWYGCIYYDQYYGTLNMFDPLSIYHYKYSHRHKSNNHTVDFS